MDLAMTARIHRAAVRTRVGNVFLTVAVLWVCVPFLAAEGLKAPALADDSQHHAADELSEVIARERRQVPTSSPSPLYHQYTVVPYYDSSVDSLASSEARLIKNVLVPGAANYLSKVVQLNASSSITISRACNGTSSYVNKQVNCDNSCAAKTTCGPVTVPQGHLRGCFSCQACTGTTPMTSCCRQTTPDGPGVMAHLLLYVSAVNTTACAAGNILMESSHCEQEPMRDRPIAGYLNFCPKNATSLVTVGFHAAVNRVLRYLIRVLGFNSDLFGYFRTLDGTPLTHRNADGLPYFSGVYVTSDLTLGVGLPPWPVANGTSIRHEVRRLVTPTVKREVQSHFACTRLPGAELELQTGDLDQWEERLFHMDIMSSAVDFRTAIVSRVTLALLQDTGWYNVDLSLGEKLPWGRDLGCNFVLQDCLGWINAQTSQALLSLPFCTNLFGVAPLVCSNSLHALARCNLQVFPTSVPRDYQYFTSYGGINTPFHLGGRNVLADYCPMIQEYENNGQMSLCENPAASTVFPESVQSFGHGSRCATHNTVWTKTDISTGAKTMLTDFTAGCYRFSCQQQQVGILIGGQNFTCAYDFQWVSVSVDVAGFRYAGTLVCPMASDICTGFGCPNDCSFHGVCITASRTCQCRPGYFGADCSSSFFEMWQDCASAPCRHGGTCTDTASGYTCTCPPGYTGNDCADDVDECRSQPCLNGASCVNAAGAFLCACPYGFTGSRCETDVSFCLSSPCQNGATCTLVDNGSGKHILCQCPATHRGDFCSDPVASNCRILPCRSGICVASNNTLGAACSCFAGYTGLFCSAEVDYCLVEPCLNAGTCSNGRVYRNCTCTSQYYGDACENKIVRCSPTLCSNGGTCQDSAIGGVCTCPATHTGRYCDQALFCHSSPCQHGATCSDAPDVGFNCTCSAGYTGARCGTDIDECAAAPCQHGARCVDMLDAFSCSCVAGFTGTRCEVDINECQSLPCMNGQCIDRVDSYLCNCSAGFAGPQCKVDIDVCALHRPCRNGATCVDGINSYACLCAAGYAGKDCDVDVLECASQPCSAVGAAACRDGVGVFSCDCRAGFTGRLCSVDVDECTSSPCGNGTCLDRMNGYVCACRPGFTGARCLSGVDECVSLPCHNGGLCVDGVARFSCRCPAHWTGALCETQVDPCSSAPCVNGGTCGFDAAAGVLTCSCATGFSGDRCDAATTTPTPPPPPTTTTAHCAATGCANGGTCLPASGACSCPPAYVGVRCEVIVVGCFSTSCMNGGSCTSLDGGVTPSCACPDGFFGDRCQTSPCSSSPCGTARCHAIGATEHECVCAAGTYGETCAGSVRVNHCLSAPCANFGTCTSFGSQFACKCAPGFTGERCQTNANECLSSPCLNNGICRDGMDRFACLCPNGLTGDRCETLLDACLSSPCRNGGRCVGGNGRFACACSAKYTGDRCQFPATHSCELLDCRNGATCVHHSNGTVSCMCANGFGGPRCQDSVHACSSSPCRFGGECIGSVQAPDWFVCNCSVGYRGDLCEIAEACEPNPCQNGGHCGPDDTSQYGFACRCTFGFVGQFCQLVNDPCASNPCSLGSICSRTVSGKYHCACAFPTAGPNCRSATDAASYSGSSLSLVRLETPVRQTSFDVRMDVRPYTGEGLLLAMAWGDEEVGDFVAMALVGGRVHVRYELGGKAGSASASKVLAVDKWQVVGVAMRSQTLWITSDDASDTHMAPQPAAISASVLYIGGASDQLLQRAQFSSNFYGCVLSSITVAPGSLSLTDLSRVTHFDVQACEQSPCERLGRGCASGGSCHPHAGSFVCSCPLGLGGFDCRQALTFYRPQFQGLSYLSLKPVAGVSGQQSRFEIVFRTQHPDGLLLLAMQKNDGVGDFLSVSLSTGTIQFRFDCGGDPVVISATSSLALHQWHNVTVWRDGSKGWLAVDGGPAVFGESKGPLQQLDLLYGMYLGGHPSDVLPPIAATPSGLTTPFQGCVASLLVDRLPQDLASSSKSLRSSSGVAQCGASSFCRTSCRGSHLGVCRESPSGKAECVCPLSSGGANCNDSVDFKSASFTGVGYLTLDAAMYNTSDLATDVDFQMRPTHPDGMVLALTQGEPGLGGTDYLWLSLANRTLRLQLDLGSGPVTVSSGLIALDTWTRVQIVRSRNNVILIVGGDHRRATSPGNAVGLTDATQLYLGGVPTSSISPYGLGVAFGLRGCIASVRVGGLAVVSLEVAAVEAEGVDECTASPPT